MGPQDFAEPVDRTGTVVLVSFYVIICLLATFLLATKITGDRLGADASQNVRAASHLAHYGIIANDRKEPPSRPTMDREPIPIMALAAWILTNPTTAQARPYQTLFEGEPAASLKAINLLWAFLFYSGVCTLVCLIFTKLIWRIFVPIFVILLTNYSFMAQYVDKLNTEPVCGSILVWSSVFMLRLLTFPTLLNAIVLGLGLAALTLTKASFFYISIVAIPILGFLLLGSSRLTMRGTAKIIGVVALSFLLSVSIWAIRNSVETGRFAITGNRGVDVLFYRVLIMEYPMNGVLFAFTPPPLQPLVGTITGYNPDDLRSGGRLADFGSEIKNERLKTRRRDIYRSRMEAAGVMADGAKGKMPKGRKAEKWLSQEALRSYISKPASFLIWPGIFGYKASFFLTPVNNENLSEVGPLWFQKLYLWLCMIIVANFLFVSVGYLMLRRNISAVFLLPLGSFIFYAFFTHAHPRYFEPLTPFVWLAVVLTLRHMLRPGRWTARA